MAGAPCVTADYVVPAPMPLPMLPPMMFPHRTPEQKDWDVARVRVCAELRDNIINQTCKGIPNPKKKFACFSAAWATYEQCLSED